MKEELKKKYEEKYFENNPLMRLHEIADINHKPHPFMIGPNHVAHAADHHSGKLREETLKAIPCAHKDCGLSYEDHTYDRVLVLQLKKTIKDTEARDFLTTLIDDFKADKIDGFMFIETEEQFRIESSEKGPDQELDPDA